MGANSNMVSLVNTATPKHAAAPNIADSRWRGEQMSTNAVSSHAIARLSRYTVRLNAIDNGETAKMTTAAVLAHRDISTRRARSHSRPAVSTATATMR